MRDDYVEEGRKLRQMQADEILRLETIKSNKINALKNTGIEDHYISTLAKKKVVL